MPSRGRIASVILVGALVLGGCREEPAGTGGPGYPLKGTVVAVNPADRTVTVEHEEIPGFMPAMTMPFVVLEKDAVLLEHVAPGDEITARLVVSDSRYWLEDLVVVTGATRDPNAWPESRADESHQLQPGQELPDVTLLNEDGETVRLADYRGRALAVTFVFTRCPFPDFCPLMMKSFAAAQALLIADEDLRSRTHLLTVSFDPEHDTPAVLREYGRPFQKTTPPFTQWELAAGTDEAIRTLGEALGLEYVEESRSFTHNLRTAVVDTEGRLHRLFRGNDWTPEELVAELEAAAAPVLPGGKD
jgi:protein SCO1/2